MREKAFIARRTYQATDEQLATTNELDLEREHTINYCFNDLCNGVAAGTTKQSDTTRCYYCRATSDDPRNRV